MFNIVSDKTVDGLAKKLQLLRIKEYLTTWCSQGYFFQSIMEEVPEIPSKPKVTKKPKAEPVTPSKPKAKPKVTKKPK